MKKENKAFAGKIVLFLFLWFPMVVMSQAKIIFEQNGKMERAHFGDMVSLSHDGNTLAVLAGGQFIEMGKSGQISVFDLSRIDVKNITSQGERATATLDVNSRVHLSGNGKRLAKTTNLSGHSDVRGYVEIMEEVEGKWIPVGNGIEGEAAYDNAGAYVSLSYDGKRIAIGSVLNNENGEYAGHVRIYEEENKKWRQIGEDIDGANADDLAGNAVLAKDGRSLVIGAEGSTVGATKGGYVAVFQENAGEWEQMGKKITAKDSLERFGSHVDISSGGTRIAVSAPANGHFKEKAGQVRVYDLVNGQWVQVGSDINGEEIMDGVSSISISGDGTTVAIGSRANNVVGMRPGRIRVFRLVEGQWVQVVESIIDKEVNWSLDLSHNGSRLAVGVPCHGNMSSAGWVKVYDLPSDDQEEER